MTIFAFVVLTKVENNQLNEHAKVFTYQCGFPIFPNNNVECTDLNFGGNVLETNHKITCKDKIETQMDHTYSSYVHCGKEDVTLDTPKGHCPMCEAFLETKELVTKDRGQVDMDRAMMMETANA